jgi:acyl-CoA synthetase (AMP-forming)/AMP-acid ligase II
MSPVSFLQRPGRWLEAISRYKATISGAPNFAYDLCVRKIGPQERAQLDLSSWRVAFNGAEPIFHETMKRFAAAFADCGFRPESFCPCYGLAEATLFVSGAEADELPIVTAFQAADLENHRAIPVDAGRAGDRSLVSSGNVSSGQRVAIVQPDRLTECPDGEVGEVWVSGPSVARGYWRRQAETEQAFRAFLPATGEGPFLRTGDLGFTLKGELFITGRLKDMIIIDGQNHYPQDLELTVEKSHSAIRPGCCAAFSIEADGREELVVVAELDRQHRHLGRDVILKAVRQAIAEQHDLRLAHFSLLGPGEIPKTSSGKIRRRACRANFLSTLAGELPQPA